MLVWSPCALLTNAVFAPLDVTFRSLCLAFGICEFDRQLGKANGQQPLFALLLDESVERLQLGV